MSIVIRLDVPALERLIGGDSEVEVQLRHGIVEAFAKRHLVAVLKDKAFAEIMANEAMVLSNGLRGLMEQSLGAIKSDGFGRVTVTLRTEVMAALTQEAEKRVGEVVRAAIDNAWARREKLLVEECARAVIQRQALLTESTVRDLVRDRLAKIADDIKAGIPERKPETGRRAYDPDGKDTKGK